MENPVLEQGKAAILNYTKIILKVLFCTDIINRKLIIINITDNITTVIVIISLCYYFLFISYFLMKWNPQKLEIKIILTIYSQEITSKMMVCKIFCFLVFCFESSKRELLISFLNKFVFKDLNGQINP